MEIDSRRYPLELPVLEAFDPTWLAEARQPPRPEQPTNASVPLMKLVVARSDDKGNHSNVGIVARHPKYLSRTAEALEEGVVVDQMQHMLDPQAGQVDRWYLPGSHNLNFLLENTLGGGDVASLCIDPQGKVFTQQLLEFSAAVSQALVDALETQGR